VRQPLEERRSSAIGHASSPVDDDVLVKPHVVARARFDGQRDAWVAANVVELAVLGQMRGDDLVAVKTHPHDRDLGAAVGLERDEMREARALEHGADGVWDRGHGDNLPHSQLGQLVKGHTKKTNRKGVAKISLSGAGTGKVTVTVRAPTYQELTRTPKL
jgi:hypothetical protein